MRMPSAEFESYLLHSPDAPLTPAGGGDVLDQEFLGWSARVVFLKRLSTSTRNRLVSSASKTMFPQRDHGGYCCGRRRFFLAGWPGPIDLAPLAREAAICLGGSVMEDWRVA